jgi:hypothetical protein
MKSKGKKTSGLDTRKIKWKSKGDYKIVIKRK